MISETTAVIAMAARPISKIEGEIGHLKFCFAAFGGDVGGSREGLGAAWSWAKHVRLSEDAD